MLNIPEHKNCVNCGECCGLIPATAGEIAVIRKYLEARPPIVRMKAVAQSGRPLACPFRDEEIKRCMVYPVRPLACRLMGVTRETSCPQGNSANLKGRQFIKHLNPDHLKALNDEDWTF